LAGFAIQSIEEMTLSAGASLNNTRSDRPVYLSIDDSITLQPMQIRTFRCTVRNMLSEKRNKIRERFMKSKIGRVNVNNVDEMETENGPFLVF
jgi:hypothetical protein